MSARMTVSRNTMKIRMYNTRFGDCFLLAFHGDDENPRYVLIDCGIHHGYKSKQKKETIKKVVRSLKQATNKHIHLLVVTHEHTDHIDGFKLATKTFEEFTIDSVWMGWTENYDDPKVKKLDKKFFLYLEALQAAQEELSKSQKRQEFARRIEGVLGFNGVGPKFR